MVIWPPETNADGRDFQCLQFSSPPLHPDGHRRRKPWDSSTPDYIQCATRGESNTCRLQWSTTQTISVRMEVKHGQSEDGEEFNMTVGNTDNDVRERHTLQINFPEVLLLLCRFHTWQAW